MTKLVLAGFATILLTASALFTAVAAQTSQKGTAVAGKINERLPGLDKRLIDNTADPCTDFFQYACGNFPKLYPIPSDRPALGTGTLLAQYNQGILHTMLERAAGGGAGRPPNQQKIGDYYAACMDTEAINRQFDANGNLADWWTAADAKKFEEKAECEVKEYGSFVAVDDVNVNGKLTLGENTADNGGLRLAYIAFLADAKRKGIDLDEKQDGYTPAQQFFLGHGQSWCGATRPEQLRLQVQTDPHSPRKFRVNGVVQNMSEFGHAFGCTPGQPMMPVNACRVW